MLHMLVDSHQSSQEEYPICAGIPQGSVLGPLLWDVFFNDLQQLIPEAHTHAGDCTLSFHRDTTHHRTIATLTNAAPHPTAQHRHTSSNLSLTSHAELTASRQRAALRQTGYGAARHRSHLCIYTQRSVKWSFECSLQFDSESLTVATSHQVTGTVHSDTMSLTAGQDRLAFQVRWRYRQGHIPTLICHV